MEGGRSGRRPVGVEELAVEGVRGFGREVASSRAARQARHTQQKGGSRRVQGLARGRVAVPGQPARSICVRSTGRDQHGPRSWGGKLGLTAGA
eukprot:13696736-Alexandrium_andersonii.AAC.1